LSTCYGHSGEISKVSFNPNAHLVITASSDKTCRLWDTETGDCIQRLQGHVDEIFSCAFNYEGDTIITGSKDNSCRIWKSVDSMKKRGEYNSPLNDGYGDNEEQDDY
jgi:dynein assembly factor with WDR repeat domains 1